MNYYYVLLERTRDIALHCSLKALPLTRGPGGEGAKWIPGIWKRTLLPLLSTFLVPTNLCEAKQREWIGGSG